MSAGFRTFNPQLNCWNDEVYQCTSESILSQWLNEIPFAQKGYREKSISERASFLEEIYLQLTQSKAEIKETYMIESGLSEVRFEAEWQRTMSTILDFAQYLRSNYQEEKSIHIPSENIRIIKRKYPIGPVLVLGSSNFPLAYSTIGGDTVAAFASGCCVIVKAHPMHVGTSRRVAECIQEAVKKCQLAERTFTHVIDEGTNIAQQLCVSDVVQAVGFTGSYNGGKALMDLAQSRKQPIPVFAEMGSLNPMIILDGLSVSKQKEFAQKIALSITNDAGQFCTKPGVIFIPKTSIGQSFYKELKQVMLEMQVVPMLHPRIHQQFELRKKSISEQNEVQLFEYPYNTEGIQGKWALCETDLLDFDNHSMMKEEVFGPFSLIVWYNSESALKEVVLSLGGQLTGTVIFPEESSSYESWISLLSDKVGRIILNGVPTGVRVVETMQHGGPFPASSDPRYTAVGTDSMNRFQKEVSIQS